MIKRGRKRDFYLELLIAASIFIVCSAFLIFTDFFEWWFKYTRAHEGWELDELFSLVFALLIAGSVSAVRHVLMVRRLMKRLYQANRDLKAHKVERIRHEKMIALGSLASGLAHEINNSMQPVVGLGGFILEGLKESGNETHYEYMKTIMNSTEHSQGIINNVLIFAREKSLEYEALDAFKILPDAIKFSTDVLPSSVVVNVSFDVETDNHEAIYINVNRTGFYQIFYNMLNNASAAMDNQGAIDISLALDVIPEAPHEVALRVDIKDTGCGIDPDIQSKIFDPFFSTKDISEGTGLGLPTVYALVEQHGGCTVVNSIVGKGTVFSLYFPIVEKSKE